MRHSEVTRQMFWFLIISSIEKYLYSIADVTSIRNIFRDTSALVLPPPILLASLCALGGLKEVNTGVRMRWYLSNPSFTSCLVLCTDLSLFKTI